MLRWWRVLIEASVLLPFFFSPLLEVALTTDTTHAQASLSQSSQNPLQFKVNWLFFWHLASAVFFLCIIWKQYSLNSTQVQKVTAYMKWVNLNKKRKEQISLFKCLSFWTADRCYRLREFFPQHCVTCCLNITYVLRINPDLVKALQCILLQISFPSHVTKKSKFIRIISTQVSNCSAVSFALKCHWWGGWKWNEATQRFWLFLSGKYLMFKPSSEEGKEKKKEFHLRVNVKTLAQGCRANSEAIYLAWFTSSSCVRLCASRDSLVFYVRNL